jgi:hypothetical protein
VNLKRVVADDCDLVIHEVSDASVVKDHCVARVGVHAWIADVEEVTLAEWCVDGYELLELMDLIVHGSVHLGVLAELIVPVVGIRWIVG